MSKKLIFLISIALVLAWGAHASGDELVASYEPNEMTDLTISTPGEATLTVTRVVGGTGGAPAATNGSYILKWVWTAETDRKITMRHEWGTRRLDLAPYNLFTVDVWYDEPNAQPATIGIWDDVFGWAGALSVPTGLQQWHTVEMDANGLDANDVDHMAAFLFESLAGDAGVIYTDNMWLLEAPQVTAWMPKPFAGAVSVDPNADLSWFAGIKADTHDVYFGTSFAEVNDATTSSSEFKGNQALGNTSYEPGTLEWLTSYYWRIDEVNTSEANSPWKGDVWSFKTDPELGYVEIPLVSYEDSETHYDVWASPAVAGDDFSLTLGDKLAEGSTWTELGKSVTVPTASDGNNVLGLRWTDEDDLEVEHSYTFLDGFTYDLSGIDEIAFDIYYAANDIDGGFNPLPHSMGLWDGDFAPAFNGTSNLPETRGEWHTIVIDVSHLDNTGQVDMYSFMFQGHGEDFRPDDEDPNNWGALVFMDNLRLRYAATPLASFPRPADGATGVPLVEDLNWRAGLYAASHDVYFGTGFAEVNDATTSSSEFMQNQALGNTSYDPGVFAPSATYYWRIDEVNGPNTWKGNVWSFTTLDSLLVDDFDSYVNTAALTAVWHDYWTNGTGAQVFLETDPQFTRDGNSMEFWYDNPQTKGKYLGSEADASTADLVCGPDWTAGGVKGLVLRYYGDATNSITASDKMYVALEDASSNVGVLEHPDMNEFQVEDWREWNIDMEDFNALGLDLTNISKVYIGFGGPRVGQSSAGGSGTVHFDDIELLKPRCVWWLARPEGDFTDDCVIDEWDLEIMARDWLIGDYNVVGAPLSSAGLVARYEFEGNANDSNGSNHGTVIGAPTYPAGVSGQAISLDGILDYVVIAGSNTPGHAFDINDAITVAAWINVDAFDNDYATIISKGDDAWRLARNLNNDRLEFACTGVTSGSVWGHIVGGTSVDDGQWHHAAGVYDGSGLYLYIDGVLDSWDEATGFMNNNSYEVYIGENAEATGRLWNGLLDDVRVYNRGLSHGEITSLAGESEVYQPVASLANLSDDEAKHSKIVNFKDYALMAENWLRELLFPFE
ncbi:MAG: LamG domain-containing protein [Planctomycetota bacterium]|nr:MAG: LamG domain-containing protein [Planctomycetota bacterium]